MGLLERGSLIAFDDALAEIDKCSILIEGMHDRASKLVISRDRWRERSVKLEKLLREAQPVRWIDEESRGAAVDWEKKVRDVLGES